MNRKFVFFLRTFKHLFLLLHMLPPLIASSLVLSSCSDKVQEEQSPPPQNEPVNNSPAPTEEPAAPVEEDVNLGDRNAYDKMRQEQLEIALKIRTQMLSQASMESERNQKLGPFTQYVLNYDFQRWSPFRTFEKDEKFFLTLQELALRDVFEKWEKNRAAFPAELFSKFDLFSGHQKSEWLLAFALCLDEVSAIQKQNAKDFKFQEVSIVEILESSLERASTQTVPQTDLDALIWKNRNTVLEILEFRYNGYTQLGYEIIERSSGSRTLYFRSMNVREIEFSARMFQTALSAKMAIEKAPNKARVDPDVRRRLTRLKTTRAEKELLEMSEGEKRKFALELYKNLENLKAVF